MKLSTDKANEILSKASQRFTDFQSATEYWNQNILKPGFAGYEGEQWSAERRALYDKDGIDIFTINKTSPLVDSVSGFEIQNRTEVSYQPRLADDEARAFNDIAESAVKYISQDAFIPEQNSHAFKDMCICGIGATHTTFSYDENPSGETEVNRIFPGFLMYDTAARKKNLKDANWMAFIKVVDRDTADRLIEDSGDSVMDGYGGYTFDCTRFYDWYWQNNITNLSYVIEYEYREKEPIWRVENPFYGVQGDELVDEYRKIASDRYNIKLDDRITMVDAKNYSQFRKDLDALGIKIKSTKQQTYHYYRCMIADGKIIEHGDCISQTGFSIKVMTGKYSEIRQCYYGIVHSVREAQRLLNEAVSDYKGYLSTIPKGGVEIEADAVSDINAFKRNYAKAKKVTVYNPGALAQGKVRPKQPPQMSPGLLEMIPNAGQWMMESVGLNNEFLGMMDSKLMTAELQGQIVRQGLTVLATYFDAKSNYMIEQGKLLIDCVRIMAENYPGRLIRNVTGQGSASYLPLFEDGIAAEYDVVISEVPQAPGERTQTFNSLVELSDKLLQTKGVDILPIVLRYSSLKKDDVEEIEKLIQPVPQQPDPLQQRLIASQAMLQEANAEKLKADAVQIRLNSLLKQKDLEYYNEKADADIAKVLTDAGVSMAQARNEVEAGLQKNIMNNFNKGTN